MSENVTLIQAAPQRQDSEPARLFFAKRFWLVLKCLYGHRGRLDDLAARIERIERRLDQADAVE